MERNEDAAAFGRVLRSYRDLMDACKVDNEKLRQKALEESAIEMNKATNAFVINRMTPGEKQELAPVVSKVKLELGHLATDGVVLPRIDCMSMVSGLMGDIQNLSAKNPAKGGTKFGG